MLPVRLALRALVARGARGRSLLFVIVGATTWLAFASVLAAGSVTRHEDARADALTPVLAPDGAGLAYAPMVHRYRGRDVLIVRVAPTTSMTSRQLLPGGVDLPDPGEVVVSPALADRLHDDPTLSSWFADRDVRVLPQRAVGSAGELRAYVRALDDRGLPRATAFGGDSAPSRSRVYATVGLITFVVVPAIALMIVASRFGRGVRVRRHRALRLLGMPHAAAAFVSAVEIAAPACAGAAIAAGLTWWLLPAQFVLPIAHRYVFARDAALGIGRAAALAAAVAAVSAVLGAVSASDTSLARRFDTTARRLRRPLPVLAALYAIGFAAVATAWLRHTPRDPLLSTGAVVIGIATPGAVAWIAAAASRALGRPALPLAALLAMRRIAADAKTATRTAGAVAVAVFVAGAAQPISQVVAQPTVPWIDAATAEGRSEVLARAETLDRAHLSLRERPVPPSVHADVPAVGVWLAAQNGSQRPAAAALVATCEQLRTLTGTAGKGCVDGRRYRLADSDEGELHLRGVDGRVASFALPEDRLDLGAQEIPIDAVALLPPNDAALAAVRDPFTIAAYLRVDATDDGWETARAWIIAASPAHRLENVFEASAVTDTTPQWLLLGLAVVAGFAAIGAVLSAADDRSRRGQWSRLRALGMSRLHVVSVQVVEALVTSSAAVLVATAASGAVTAAYLRVNAETLQQLAPFVVAAACALVTIVVATTAAAAVAQTDRVGASD